jgi:hypothetical protein
VRNCYNSHLLLPLQALLSLPLLLLCLAQHAACNKDVSRHWQQLAKAPRARR